MEAPIDRVPSTWQALAHQVLNAPDADALEAAAVLAERVLAVGPPTGATPTRPDDFSVRRELVLRGIVY